MKFKCLIMLFVASTVYGQDLEWVIASEGILDTPKDIVIDQSNEVYLTGAYEAGAYRLDTVSIPWIPTGSDIFLTKLNDEGHALWSIFADGILNDAGLALAPAADEGVYWAGRFQSPTLGFQGTIYSRIGASNSLVAKIDTDGIASWVDQLHTATGNCLVTDLLETAEGVIAIGNFSGDNFEVGDALFDALGLSDPFIIEYDNEGNHEWVRTFPGDDNETFSTISKIESDYIVGGQFYGESFGMDDVLMEGENATGMLVRLSKLEGALWGRTIASDGDVFVNSVVSDEEELIYCGGYFTGDTCFIASDTLYGSGFHTAWFASFDGDGELRWSKILEGTSTTTVSKLYFYADSILVAGDYRGTIELGGDEFSSEGQTDVFLYSADENGNPAWQRTYGGDSFETTKGLTMDEENNFYLTAEFLSNPLSIDGESFSLGHPSGTEIFIMKGARNNFDLGIQDENISGLNFYPNPAKSLIVFSKPVVKCEIIDLSGKTVFYDMALNKEQLSIENLPNGIYVLNLDGERFKLIKQP